MAKRHTTSICLQNLHIGPIFCLSKSLFSQPGRLDVKASPKVRLRHSMFFPKGVNAKLAILKCCFPKGMPIMVMQSNSPNAR